MKKPKYKPRPGGTIKYEVPGKRKNTFPCAGIGGPRHMSAAERLLWDELRAQIPPSLLSWQDRPAFALLVRVTCRQRTSVLTIQEGAELADLQERFALTPRLRKRFALGPPNRNGRVE